MSFDRPSLSDLDARIRADMEANMDAVPIVRRRSTLAGIARAQAGAAHELHGHADHTFRQLFPDTSSLSVLLRQAGFYGLVRRQASQARGAVVVQGDDGTLIPIGTRFGSKTGVEFITTEDGIIAAGTVTITIEAALSGTEGNLATGTMISFLSPVAGASNEAQIAAPGLALGADIESKESLSERVTERMRKVPHGGAAHDYVRWAKEVPGVTRAWLASGEMGLGSVTLRFAVDDSPTGPIPSDAEVQAVKHHIDSRADNDDSREGRPVTAWLFVAAPIPDPVDVTLSSIPNDEATRAAIRAELDALFRNSGRPNGVVPIGTMSQAVSLVPGLTSRTLHEPTSDAAPRRGYLPVLGDVRWI